MWPFSIMGKKRDREPVEVLLGSLAGAGGGVRLSGTVKVDGAAADNSAVLAAIAKLDVRLEAIEERLGESDAIAASIDAITARLDAGDRLKKKVDAIEGGDPTHGG